MALFSHLNRLREIIISKSRVNISYSTQIKNDVIHVNSQKINYVKVGHGDKNILCFPGALGTIWSDFKPQIENLNREKFTVIAWDPPGRGYSRKPGQFYTPNFYEDDADTAYAFLKELGVEKVSLLGWSDGGISSIILAGKHPENVENLIVWGSNAFLLPEEMKFLETLRDVRKWSERARAPHIEMYGMETFQKLQDSWLDSLQEILKTKNGDVCISFLKHIKCPTLILHGDKDPVIDKGHPVHLSENIKGSKLHRFPDGKHNIHLKYSKEFNEIITKFILNDGAI